MRFILRQAAMSDRDCAIEVLGEGRYVITLDGVSFTLEARPLGAGGYALIDGENRSIEAWVHGGQEPDARAISLHDGVYHFSLLSPAAALLHAEAGGAGGVVAAPMPGRLVKLLVSAGEAVEAGQPLCVVEAMKMQNELSAPAAGIVTDVRCKAGDQVAAGAPILTVIPNG